MQLPEKELLDIEPKGYVHAEENYIRSINNVRSALTRITVTDSRISRSVRRKVFAIVVEINLKLDTNNVPIVEQEINSTRRKTG